MAPRRDGRSAWLASESRSLEEAILRLRHIHSAVVVAVAALRGQNCELDEDIARLLQRCVCDALADQLERLEASRRLHAA